MSYPYYRNTYEGFQYLRINGEIYHCAKDRKESLYFAGTFKKTRGGDPYVIGGCFCPNEIQDEVDPLEVTAGIKSSPNRWRYLSNLMDPQMGVPTPYMQHDNLRGDAPMTFGYSSKPTPTGREVAAFVSHDQQSYACGISLGLDKETDRMWCEELERSMRRKTRELSGGKQ